MAPAEHLFGPNRTLAHVRLGSRLIDRNVTARLPNLRGLCSRRREPAAAQTTEPEASQCQDPSIAREPNTPDPRSIGHRRGSDRTIYGFRGLSAIVSSARRRPAGRPRGRRSSGERRVLPRARAAARGLVACCAARTCGLRWQHSGDDGDPNTRDSTTDQLVCAMRPTLLLLLGAVAMVRNAAAHGAVTIPPPREAIDGDTAPWNGAVPWPIPFDKPNWCAHPSAERAGKDKRNLTGANGQVRNTPYPALCSFPACSSPGEQRPFRHVSGSRTAVGLARPPATATPGSWCHAAPTSTYGTAPRVHSPLPLASAMSTAASS